MDADFDFIWSTKVLDMLPAGQTKKQKNLTSNDEYSLPDQGSRPRLKKNFKKKLMR